VVLCLPVAAFGDYLKIDPPPDVDKNHPDLTCWIATAANMLAGAGYGPAGLNDQQRAEAIYNQLRIQFGSFQ
jgi:hypothetical protein